MSETPRFTPAHRETLSEAAFDPQAKLHQAIRAALAEIDRLTKHAAADVLEAQQQEIDRLQVELKGWQMSHAKLYAVRTGEPERTP